MHRIGAHAQDDAITVAIATRAAPTRSGWAGVVTVLAHQLERLLGGEVRTTLLGHLQRGGPPTAFDRVLATRFGYAAAQLVRQQRWGQMVTLAGSAIGSVTLSAVAGRNRPVPAEHPVLAAARGVGVALEE